MADELSQFVLPRLDWYDEQGRIYKDALIENFNAIEQKLIELEGLDVFEVRTPDWDEISLDDSTLNSDDTQIVNLRSLIDIMNLIHIPIEVNISNKKVVKASYYGSDYNIHAVTNQDLSSVLSTATPWVFIDTQSNTAITSSDAMLDPDRYILIGVYTDDYRIAPVFEQHCDYDVIKALSRMPIEYSMVFTREDNSQYRACRGLSDSRLVASSWMNKKPEHVNADLVYFDYGRNGAPNRALTQKALNNSGAKSDVRFV